jgi:hypothetical protein
VIKATRWGPDTCDCIVEYEWDTDVAEANRVHTFKSVINTGPEHAALVGSTLYDEVVSENRRKNLTQGIAEAIDVNLTREVHQWAFDANRVLEISFLINVPPPVKQQIQDACDLQFGPGKVRIL